LYKAEIREKQFLNLQNTFLHICSTNDNEIVIENRGKYTVTLQYFDLFSTRPVLIGLLSQSNLNKSWYFI